MQDIGGTAHMERDHYEDLDASGRIILGLILKK
jgi:hypothetical protein